MKKLMTLIGAVATALGLYAADLTEKGRSFEAEVDEPGVEANVFTATAADGWLWNSADTFTLKAQEGALPYEESGSRVRRNADFPGKAKNDQYLYLETGTNVLAHTVADGDIYLDQLVKFTGFEEYQTSFADNAKVAIWMSAIETEGVPEDLDYIAGETNLYVSVGKQTDDGFVQDKINLGNAYKLDTWYRLTVRSVGNIMSKGDARQGFVIYIDGHQVATDALKSMIDRDSITAAAQSFYDKGQLFPAMNVGGTQMATVGYQGIGGIDDLIIDNVGPEFAKYVDVSFAPIEGALIAKVVDEDGNEFENVTGTINAKAGQLTVTLAANGPYVLKKVGAYTVSTTDAKSGVITISVAEGDIVKAAAQVVNVATPTVIKYYAEEDLYASISVVSNGDTVTFLQGCSIVNDDEDTLYTFTKGSTIDVAAGGIWEVNVANDGGDCYLVNNVGAYPGKQITVTFDSDEGFIKVVGNIYGKGDKETKLVVGGKAKIGMAGLTIGEELVNGGSFGATLKATVVQPMEDGEDIAQITLVGDGKVVTTSELDYEGEDSVFTNDNIARTEEEIDDVTWYTYSIRTGGFMVILAGQSTGNTYSTLADAVEAANAGDTIKLVAAVDPQAKLTLTKNIKLDLNGFTLSALTDTSSLFVIRDCTLTINGTTADSAMVGRINVGESVTEGGVKKHWAGNLVINGGEYSVGNGQTVVHVNGDCKADENVTVSITDATITSPTDNGVQFNGYGTYTITGSTITGATAVYCKAGSLTVVDSDLIANGAKVNPTPNTNGSNATGDAIVLDTMTGYQGKIALSVDADSSIKSDNGYAILETVTGGSASATLSITDNGAEKDAKLGALNVSDKFLAAVAAGKATVTGYAAAVNGNVYATLAAAVAAAGANDTVTLVANVALDATLTINKAITVDLGKKTVTLAASAARGVDVTAAATIKNGKIVSSSVTDFAGYSSAIRIFPNIDATFEDLEIDGAHYRFVFYCDSVGGDNKQNEFNNPPTSTVTCNNVDVKGNGTLFYAQHTFLNLDANCSATSEGTPSTAEGYHAAIYSVLNSTVTVAGGSYSNVNALVVGNLGGKIIIADGTVLNGNIKSYMYKGDGRFQNNVATIKISGGTVNGQFVFADDQCTKDEVTWDITGGTFTSDPTAYLAAGYYAKQDGETWTVLPKTGFAIIIAGTTTYYDTFAEAVEQVAEGGTITLMAAINDIVRVMPGTTKSFTLDMNGMTITSANNDAIQNNGTGTLTITGNGTAISGASDGCAVWARTGKIVIENGTFENNSTAEATVYVTTDNNQITINGGTFKNKATSYKWRSDWDKGIVLNAFNTMAGKENAFVINAGSFSMSPAAGDDSNVPPTFLGSTKAAKFNSETSLYDVVAAVANINDTFGYASLAEANAAAKDGDTIKLLADVTVDARIEITKAITIDLDSKKVTRTAALDAKNTYSGNGSVFDLRANAGNVTIKNGTIDCLALTQTVEDTKSIVPDSSTPYCECDAITVRSGANLTLTDMTVLVDNITGCCVYPFNGGTVAITSGTYENRTTEEYTLAGKNIKAMVVNQHNATPQSLVISGGQFKGQNPATGDDSGAVVTFLAKGKATSKVGEYWTIVDAVAEIGDKGYASLDEALAAAVDGDTVTLLANIATAKKEQFKVASNITLDFNGKTITKSLSNDWVIRVNNGVTAIFTDNSAAANGGIEFTPIALGNIDNPASMIQNLGNLTINGGVYASDFTVIKNDEDPGKSSLTVNGGAFTVIPVAAELGYKGKQWALMNWTDATINGGIWTGTIGTRSADRNKVSQAGATEIVALGEGSNANYLLFVGDSKDTTFTNFPKIKVTGAKIDVEKATQCPLDLELVGPDADGWYTVAEKQADPVAKIGDKEYATLEEAFADAKDGETVVLQKDFALTQALAVNLANAAGEGVTFDLGAKTLTMGDYSFDIAATKLTVTNGTVTTTPGVLTVKESSVVTIAANTTIYGTGTYKFELGAATLNVYGRIETYNASAEAGAAAIHAKVDGGIINVYDGAYIKGNMDAIRMNGENVDVTLNVYGGTLEGVHYPAVYVYKTTNKSHINVHGGTFISPYGDGAYSSLCVKYDAVGVTVKPFDGDCTAKFKYINGSQWDKGSLERFCADGYGLKLGQDGYYAVARQYKVLFVNDDVTTTNKVWAGETTTAPADPVKEGYNFLGWYNGDDKFDPTAAVNADATYTAKFELAGVYVTFAGDATIATISNNVADIKGQSVLYPIGTEINVYLTSTQKIPVYSAADTNNLVILGSIATYSVVSNATINFTSIDASTSDDPAAVTEAIAAKAAEELKDPADVLKVAENVSDLGKSAATWIEGNSKVTYTDIAAADKEDVEVSCKVGAEKVVTDPKLTFTEAKTTSDGAMELTVKLTSGNDTTAIDYAANNVKEMFQATEDLTNASSWSKDNVSVSIKTDATEATFTATPDKTKLTNGRAFMRTVVQ